MGAFDDLIPAPAQAGAFDDLVPAGSAGVQASAPAARPTPTTFYSTGKAVGGPDETQDKWTNRGYTSTGKNLTYGVAAVNEKVHPLGTILRDTQSGERFIAADRHGNADPNVVDIYLPPDRYRRAKEDRQFEVLGKVDKVADSPEGIRKQLAEFGASDRMALRKELAGEMAPAGKSEARDPEEPQLGASITLAAQGKPGARDVSATFQEGSRPYGVVADRIVFDPKRYREGVNLALKDGHLSFQAAGQFMEQAGEIEKAATQRAELEKLAGNDPKFKAVLRGAGRGGTALAGGAAFGIAGARLGPIPSFAAGIGGVLAGGKAYDNYVEAVAPYSETVRGLNASAELEPVYAAAGELAAFMAPLPSSVSKLVEGAELVNAVKGGREAAGFVAKQVGKGAAIGGGVDVALQTLHSALGDHDYDPKSTAFNAALAGLLSGHGIRFKDYDTGEVANILQRGVNGGLKTRAERDVFDKAMAQMESLRSQGAAGSPEFTARQVEGLSGPATKLETRMRGPERTGVPERSGAFDDLVPEPARAQFEKLWKPEPAAPAVPAEREPTTIFDPAKTPVVELPVKRITLSKDVPNFKEDADPDTGVVRGQQLEGKFERLGTAPIVAWERTNGATEVITGRHRLELARRSGEETIPAQIVREADGFTRQMALTFDAESNIRDGQGSTKDYAHYFRNRQEGDQPITEAEARARGLLSRARAHAGWDIGRHAGDDLYALYAGEKINEAQAVAIARAAPGNGPLQAVGARAALDGKPADYITNLVHAANAASQGRAETLDLFGRDDSAMQAIEAQARRAQTIQRGLREQISSVQGAARKPDTARKLGVDVKDPESIRQKIDALRGDLARWDNWPLHPDLVARTRADADSLSEESPIYRLRSLQSKPARTPGEQAELESLERGEGQEFFGFTAPQSPEQARQIEADRAAAAQREEVRMRAQRRLVAGPLESQADFMDSEPTLFEGVDPAQIETYVAHQGIPADRAADAADGISRTLQLAADPAMARLYEGPSQLLLDFNSKALAANAAADSPAAVRARQLQAKAIASLDPALLAEALANDNVVSSIIPKLISGEIPTWNIDGTVLATPADLAMAVQAIRSPYFESLKLVVLDDAGVVKLSRIVNVGTLNESLVDIQRIVTMANTVREQTGAKRVIVSHNHPGGNPEPSPADHTITTKLAEALRDAKLTLEDHVVTNGKSFYSMKRGGLEILPGAQLPAWETVERSKLRPLHEDAAFRDLVRVLRNGDPDVGHIIYLNTRHKITAIERVRTDHMAEALSAGMGREGALAVLFDIGAGFQNQHYADVFVNTLRERAKRQNRSVLDISSEAAPSWQAAGMHVREGGVPGSPGYVAEPGAPYGPLRAVDAKGSPYADVPLRHLDKIKILQMPELVKLAREITGQMVKLKKLPKAMGHFKPEGRGGIVLDPRIFVNARDAAKVLAHEIGHGADYLPEHTMKRGNILGRLASVRDYLATTLPIDPKGSGITPGERKAIRKNAYAATTGKLGPRPDKATLPAEHAAWNEAAAEEFRRMVAAEIGARRLATTRTSTEEDAAFNVRAELIALTDWWKPYLEAAADGKLPEHYIRYRESGVELYADFVSVLFNSPADAQARAPVTYETFFNYLDRKPDVKADFFAAWAWANQPAMARLTDRAATMKQMFATGRELFGRKVAELENRWAGWPGWLDRFKQAAIDLYSPAVRRERQVKGVPGEPGPIEKLFDEHPLADNRVFRWLERMQRTVVQPLETLGISQDDLGEFLFLDRVKNERYEVTKQIEGEVMTEDGGRSVLANPLGITPEVAQLQLLRMRLEHGLRGMTILEAAAKKFHAEVFGLVREMHDTGLLTDEQFRLIEGNRDHYATFVTLDHIEAFVPSGISQQAGTLREVQNPFISTVLKAITMHRAIEYQRTKQAAVQLLRDFFPAEIAPAETRWDGGRMVPRPPKERGVAQVMMRERGKPIWFNVPAEVAAMFERVELPLLKTLMGPLNWIFRQVFYPIFITYNPTFQFIRNPPRDTRRSVVNLPDSSPLAAGVTMRMTEARMVKDFVYRGIISPEIARGLEARAFTPPMGTFQASMGMDDPFLTMLRKFGVAPTEPEGWFANSALTGWLHKLGQHVELAGQMRELLPKVGTFKLLTGEMGWSDQDASYFVRNYVGTPNHLRKGQFTWIAGDVFPFINVWQQGWRSDIQLARRGFKRTGGGPGKSPASYWMRWMLTSGIWTVLKAAGKVGILGAGIKALYDRVGDHYLTNYDVLPLGSMPGGDYDAKTVFIPIPKDPTDRIVSGIAYKVLMSIFSAAQGQPSPGNPAATAISIAASDTPGLNPALTIAKGWGAYLSGRNPYDSFRNAFVLSDAEQKAGGTPGLVSMMGWTAKQAGSTTFVGYNPDADSTLEMITSAIPGLNGLVKFSDYGLREAQQAEEARLDARTAKVRLSMSADVQSLLQEYGYLNGLRVANRTPAQIERAAVLSQWYHGIYKPAEEEYLSRQEMKLSTGSTKTRIERASKSFMRKR